MNIDLGWANDPTNYAFAITTAALLLAFVRLVRGPSLPDRVIGLDLIAVIAVGLMSAFSIQSGQSAYLVAAAVLALIAFVGTVAFAGYLERSVRDE